MKILFDIISNEAKDKIKIREDKIKKGGLSKKSLLQTEIEIEKLKKAMLLIYKGLGIIERS